MQYRLARIGVGSVAQIVPLVTLVVALVIGPFLIFGNPTLGTWGARFLAYIFFVVLYPIIATIGLVLVVIVYNLITKRLKGLEFTLISKEDKESESPVGID